MNRFEYMTVVFKIDDFEQFLEENSELFRLGGDFNGATITGLSAEDAMTKAERLEELLRSHEIDPEIEP